MKTNVGKRKASFALLGLFIAAAAWAQQGSTINYFVSPEDKVEGQSWQGTGVSGNEVVAENQDYTTVKAEGGKVSYEYIYMPNLTETGGYKISDIKSFSITTRQDPTSNAPSNAYLNIYTQKIAGSSSPSWYESRLNVEPYYAKILAITHILPCMIQLLIAVETAVDFRGLWALAQLGVSFRMGRLVSQIRPIHLMLGITPPRRFGAFQLQ